MKTDILIVGSGVAGLYCALNLPQEKAVTIVTKRSAEESDSFLAQGGICVQRDDDDYQSFFEDTLRAGHGENNPESVDLMIRSSRAVIEDLVSFGVRFEREGDEFAYTKEGAHAKPRILFHRDETGKEITSHLLAEAKKRTNITLRENFTVTDLICDNGVCFGVYGRNETGEVEAVTADYTLLATGGIGGLYRHSTNFRHLTGDGLVMALRHGIELQNVDYVQIHPTTLYTENDGRSFLISESVRGEGAILLNGKGERFVNELLPRDAVTKAIYAEMEREGSKHVWLSLAPIPEDEIRKHFPNILKRCLEEGYDITKQPIPVVPAQHYFMGGIKIDRDGRTSMERLYAAGETACNGVHGRNRLASNSLLESLVFAKRAAEHVTNTYTKAPYPDVLPAPYREVGEQEAKQAVFAAMEKEKKRHE